MKSVLDWFQNRLSYRSYIAFLCLLGAYLNAAAYGFKYPAGADYDFELPLMNWLRNPSLYPGDPIREAYARFPTVFWPAVAALSKWFGTEHILLTFFLLTKLVFFLAVGWLVAAAVSERLLGACVVAVVSLSPLLNTSMPFGVSGVLSQIQLHSPLTIAMLLLTGVFLSQGRWWAAVILGGLSVYIDALPFLHTLPAFAVFALVDWRQHKRRIFLAACLGAVICIPWLLLSYHALAVSFPKDYLQGFLLFFPFHSTLRWTPASNLVKGAAILSATVWMCFVAREAELRKQGRLQILAVSYSVPLVLGILLGEFYLTPEIARLCLLRADSFLIPYALLLVQTHGANLLNSAQGRSSVTNFLLGVSAIVLPLSIRLAMPVLLLMLIFWTDPRKRFEHICQRLAGPSIDRFLPARTVLLATALCGLGVTLAFLHIIPSPVRLWDFVQESSPEERSCFEIQQWARTHTPFDARFLVPPSHCGFRSLSERSSWGEWMDGTGAFHFPPLAIVFLQREAEFGIGPGPKRPGVDFIEENYRHQSWDHLQTIATKNHLNFIVQFCDVRYPVAPIFRNYRYAIYPVTQ